MPSKGTALGVAAGQLISAIQKEWAAEAGETNEEASFDAMNRAHEILQAKTPDGATEVLSGRTISEFLGPMRIAAHPSVKWAIDLAEDNVRK